MRRSSTLLAWGGLGLTIAFTVGAIVLLLAASQESSAPLADLLGDILYALNGPVTALVGALIVVNRRRNPIGWIALVIGLALATVAFMDRYSRLAWRTGTNTLPGGLLAAWVAQWMWFIPYLGLVLLLLLFPTGQFLSPRWRWVASLCILAYIVMLALFAFSTPMTVLSPQNRLIEITNPVGVFELDNEAALLPIIFAWIIVPLLAALGAMLLRFVRARGLERQQMKWLVYAAALFTFWLIPTFNADNPVFSTLIDVVALGLPISIGIAILRHRLYDIDILIRRTITYAILTTLLLAAYFGSVIVLQRLFSALLGQSQNEIVTVLSTLAIAALFVPLRRGVQAFIDRRFYRRNLRRRRENAGRVRRGCSRRDEFRQADGATGRSGGRNDTAPEREPVAETNGFFRTQTVIRGGAVIWQTG
jgi:hypothetical protein